MTISFAQRRLLRDRVALYDGMRWTFTGARTGITSEQTAVLRYLIHHGRPRIVQHGGAIGADTTFHAVWREERSCVDDCLVYPSSIERAEHFAGDPQVHVGDVMEPLSRNIVLVRTSDWVLACPATHEEEQRSGTWHTIRATCRLDRAGLIIWPDGSTLSVREFPFRALRRP